MTLKPFEQFKNATTKEQIIELQQFVKMKGYSFFRKILEGLHESLKTFTDEETDDIVHMLQKAKECFPEPGRISPSWEYVWAELEQIIAFKIKLLRSVPINEREGVWQVIMDNPYTNQEVVCYPELTFMDAAYLYGYFRPGLEKNEYIQVQKVESILTEYGS